jgi:hypothetical protein
MLNSTRVGTTFKPSRTAARSTSSKTPFSKSPPYSFFRAASHSGHWGDARASRMLRGRRAEVEAGSWRAAAARMSTSGTATYAD